MRHFASIATVATATAAVFVFTACGGGSGQSTPALTPTVPSAAAGANSSLGAAALDTDHSDDRGPNPATPVLKRLNTITTIGSTVDPIDGDQNPYGLDIAKSDSGPLHAGDLVVCNFNDSNALGNVQGTGTTIVALRPQPGSAPTHVAQSADLLGCTALALAPNDAIWAAAFAANDNPIVSPNGAILTTLAGGPWHGPFGQTFAGRADHRRAAAFYESNAGDGSIVRINSISGKSFTFDVIATGFPINGGAPGGILGPSGLQYDAQQDRLYVVDGANNAVYALRHVSTIPAHGLSVDPSGTSFGGPFAHRARVVFSGAPLNGPISSALMPGGSLVIGNTLDPNGTNLMVEISPSGRLLAVKNVDTGPAGALFGMVGAGSAESPRLYFNDDNDNTVKVLTQ